MSKLSDAIYQNTPGDSQGTPMGVPPSYSWYNGVDTNYGNTPPSTFSAVTGWGQVYPANGSPAGANTGANVEVANFTTYVHLTTGQWVQVQNQATDPIAGAHYVADFSGDTHIPFNETTLSNGVASIDAPQNGYNDHFWPTLRGTYTPGTVDGVFVVASMRTTDPSADLIANVGADWWSTGTAPFVNGFANNPGAGMSNWVQLTTQFQNLYFTSLSPQQLAADPPPALLGSSITPPLTNATIQGDYLAITRTSLPPDQATAVVDAINSGAQTETHYINSLLAQVANTTIPAVAVEASMYGAVGSSAEITNLVTQFLPAQLAHVTQNGFNPTVFACEALGLAFAFSNEKGGTAFATNFGPSNPAMPATPAGDAAFAAAAASTIFGSAATANTPGAILNFVSNWEAFYTSHGIPGVGNATANQIDLAARGAAWGDAAGVALVNNLGSLPGQVTNFLEDVAQGTAIYSASLASQPTPAPFQGAALGHAAGAASAVQLTGVAAHVDHVVM
jgi:hypothetical protein